LKISVTTIEQTLLITIDRPQVNARDHDTVIEFAPSLCGCRPLRF
jgi:hypothetical protein